MNTNTVVSSRRVRKEKQKAIRQTVALLGLAVLTLLLFIFVIIPVFINGFNSFLNTSNPFEVSDSIPPQVPILSAPVEATSSAALVLSGFGEPESTVVFVLNGSQYAELTIATDGTFQEEIELTEGENTVAAYSIDAAENESALSKTFTIAYDTTPPLLDVSGIEDGTVVETRKNQSFTVSGTTEPGVKVTINGRVVFPTSDGSFSQAVLLVEGENTLVIEAIDQAGNTTSAEKKITYIP